MVRLNDENAPLVRDAEYSRNPVRTAGILCRDKQFAQYLFKKAEIEEESEADVIQWLKGELGINSRTELNEDQQKAKKFWAIYKEYRQWNPPA
jgi:hypothetical protein